MLLLAPKLRPDKAPSTSSLVSCPKSASNNFQKWFLSPTGRLNFGFITKGKLTVVIITPYSWGSQLVHAPYTNEIFAFKAWPKAQFILLYVDVIQPQTHQRHHNYQKGKEDS
jgi:hypothetical protein